jgi:predicted PilT family ATPase
MKSHYNQFQDLATKYLNEYKVEYDNKINNAIESKREVVHIHFLDSLIHVEKLKIEGVLGQKFRIIHELEEEYGIDSRLSKEDIFNQKIEAYPKKEHKQIIENLAKYDIIIKFYDQMSKDSPYAIKTKESETLPANITGIKWKGKTEIDFIHLVYALHTSGLIQNENKQVTNLVEELAKLFDFKLSKSWRQNHNSNINNTASDYRPRIFEDLEDAYMQYREKE